MLGELFISIYGFWKPWSSIPFCVSIKLEQKTLIKFQKISDTKRMNSVENTVIHVLLPPLKLPQGSSYTCRPSAAINNIYKTTTDI